jgi:actin-related protein
LKYLIDHRIVSNWDDMEKINAAHFIMNFALI